MPSAAECPVRRSPKREQCTSGLMEAMHGLPQSDAHVIYNYGRTDLRNAIRGVMLSRLQGIFTGDKIKDCRTGGRDDEMPLPKTISSACSP